LAIPPDQLLHSISCSTCFPIAATHAIFFPVIKRKKEIIKNQENKFRSLEPKLSKIAYRFGDPPEYDIAEIRDLCFALSELGIEYPVDGIDSRLRKYVTLDLLAACQNGKIEYAKTSWERRGEPPEKIYE